MRFFLEFLSRYDQGLISENQGSQNLKGQGMVRDEDEIKEMIGKSKPSRSLVLYQE